MKKRKWIIIGSLFLAAAIFLLGVSDYTQNIAPRLESIGLTYAPSLASSSTWLRRKLGVFSSEGESLEGNRNMARTLGTA